MKPFTHRLKYRSDRQSDKLQIHSYQYLNLGEAL